ncbi:DUF4162 domain-containing protein [Streptomyces sanglieri]|uniref:DUF4162 domain-containing protein n=1 Tax=Streptomyces sanglieri TaxID=193460 RepID=A0ABW2WLA4_9ACTN
MAGDRITLGTADRADAERAVELASALPTVHEVTADGMEVRIRTPRGDTQLPVLLRNLEAVGVRALTARLTRPTLDDVFLSLTGRTLRESADATAPTTTHDGA